MHLRVRIEREPVANERQAVAEVEGTKAGTWIVAPVFTISGWRRKAQKTLQEGVNRNRCVPLPSPDRGALKSKFKIVRRPETDLFQMFPWVSWIDHVGKARVAAIRICWVRHVSMASELSDQKLITKCTGDPGEQRNIQRLDAIDVERINILGIIGISHTTAEPRSKPIVLLSEGKLVVEYMDGEMNFDEAPLGFRTARPHWNRCLSIGGPGSAGVGCAVNFTKKLTQP